MCLFIGLSAMPSICSFHSYSLVPWPGLTWGYYSHSLSWAGITWWSPSLSRYTRGLNSEFPSPRLVAILRLKSQVCLLTGPITYLGYERTNQIVCLGWNNLVEPIFFRSTTGLNSEFSFSRLVAILRLKSPVCLLTSPITYLGHESTNHLVCVGQE